MARWHRRGLLLALGVAAVAWLQRARQVGLWCVVLGHAWELRTGPGRQAWECRRCGEVGLDLRED